MRPRLLPVVTNRKWRLLGGSAVIIALAAGILIGHFLWT
jgi:hypothetical protein